MLKADSSARGMKNTVVIFMRPTIYNLVKFHN